MELMDAYVKTSIVHRLKAQLLTDTLHNQLNTFKGNGDTGKSLQSSEQLADLLRQAAAAHHEYEAGLGKPDADWAGWYANWVFGKL